jgi:hypothetical protein
MLFHQRNKKVVAARTQWAAKDERGAVSGAGSIIGPPATAYPFDVLPESDLPFGLNSNRACDDLHP